MVSKINNIVTLFKVAIPIFISIVFIIFCFTLPALKDIKTEELSLMPFGFNGVLAAVSVGGIAYAFTGFKTIVELAGSTKILKIYTCSNCWCSIDLSNNIFIFTVCLFVSDVKVCA